jgi:hypothetical protein
VCRPVALQIWSNHNKTRRARLLIIIKARATVCVASLAGLAFATIDGRTADVGVSIIFPLATAAHWNPEWKFGSIEFTSAE